MLTAGAELGRCNDLRRLSSRLEGPRELRRTHSASSGSLPLVLESLSSPLWLFAPHDLSPLRDHMRIQDIRS